MEHEKYAKALRRAALAGAAVLTLFRVLTQKIAMDENGLLPRGSSFLPFTILISACVFGSLWLLSTRLNRLPGREDCFSRERIWTLPRLAAGIAVFLGAILSLLDGKTALDGPGKAVCLAGMASGLAMIGTAAAAAEGRWRFWLRLLPSLYTVAALIMRFRTWSHDPLVIHFAPMLLTWTCCMVEMMLLSGFSLEAGHRRSSVLFGLGAGVFGCMTLPDQLFGSRSSLPDLLTTLGIVLWCVTAAFDLLREQVQREQRPVEAEPETELETEAEPEPEPLQAYEEKNEEKED